VFSNKVLLFLGVRLSAKIDTILFSLDSNLQQLRNEIHKISYSMVLNQKISGFSSPETLERRTLKLAEKCHGKGKSKITTYNFSSTDFDFR